MKKFKQFMSGKGYYIALVLCAVAIGISGYLYYRNADKKTAEKPVPVVELDPTQGQNVPVVGTQPVLGGETEKPTDKEQPDIQVETKPMVTSSPVEGQIVVVYAMEQLGYNPTTRDWRTHDGMDITAAEGTPVCAAAEGVVQSVHEDDTMGFTVVISHADGYATCYSSLDSDVKVKAGDTVSLGQRIGTVGASALLESAIGEHVHFSVTRNGVAVDPVAFLNLGN